MAFNVLNQYKFTSIPINVELLAEQIGFTLRPFYNKELKSAFKGAILLKTKEIYIRSEFFELEYRYEVQYRFTIAHELAHFFLHKQFYDSLSYSSLEQWCEVYSKFQSDIGRAEKQANIFASALLIPDKYLNQDLLSSEFEIQDYYAINRLAQKYKVAYQTMEIKLAKEYHGCA